MLAVVSQLPVASFQAIRQTLRMSTTEHFERSPDICGGALVIKGTRVPVHTLLASLMEGATISEILADFPTVSPTAMQAVMAFAAAAAIDDLPVPAISVTV